MIESRVVLLHTSDDGRQGTDVQDQDSARPGPQSRNSQAAVQRDLSLPTQAAMKELDRRQALLAQSPQRHTTRYDLYDNIQYHTHGKVLHGTPHVTGDMHTGRIADIDEFPPVGDSRDVKPIAGRVK